MARVTSPYLTAFGRGLAALDRRHQGRQVRELLVQVRVVVQRLEDRRQRALLEEVSSGLGSDAMNFRKSAAVPLFLANVGDADVVATEGGDAGAGLARAAVPPRTCRRSWTSRRSCWPGVDVGPVAVEEQLAVLERLPALLFLPGDGVLRDHARLEASRPASCRPAMASGVLTAGLPSAVDELATGGVDGLGDVAGQALVLLVLAGVAVTCPSGRAGSCRRLPASRPTSSAGVEAGLVEEVLAVVEHARRRSPAGRRRAC